MEHEWTGLRAEREQIQQKPGSEELAIIRLERGAQDLERCLTGDATSIRWQQLKVELTNKKQELLHMKRRFAGRTPSMESWADPLPKGA